MTKIIRNVAEWKYWDYLNKGWDMIACNNLEYCKEFGEDFHKGKYIIVQFKKHKGKDYYGLFVKGKEPKVKPYPNPKQFSKDWNKMMGYKH